MSDRLPPYLMPAPLERRARRRRRALRALVRAALFPFRVLLALGRWLASPYFFQ